MVVVMCLQMHRTMNRIALHTLNQTTITDSYLYLILSGKQITVHPTSNKIVMYVSGIAKPGPTQAQAQAQAMLECAWVIHFGKSMCSSVTTAMGTTTMKGQETSVWEEYMRQNGLLRSVNRQVCTYTFEIPSETTSECGKFS